MAVKVTSEVNSDLHQLGTSEVGTDHRGVRGTSEVDADLVVGKPPR